MLCSSILGEKLVSLVIEKYAYPKVFNRENNKLKDLPIKLLSNKNAWMTSSIFRDWVKKST